MAAAHLDCVCPALVNGRQHSQQLSAHFSIVPILGAPASQLGQGQLLGQLQGLVALLDVFSHCVQHPALRLQGNVLSKLQHA